MARLDNIGSERASGMSEKPLSGVIGIGVPIGAIAASLDVGAARTRCMRRILLIAWVFCMVGCNKVGSAAFAPGTMHRVEGDKIPACDSAKSLATLDQLRAEGNRVHYEDWKVSNCDVFYKGAVVTISNRDVARQYVGVTRDGDSREYWLHASSVE